MAAMIREGHEICAVKYGHDQEGDMLDFPEQRPDRPISFELFETHGQSGNVPWIRCVRANGRETLFNVALMEAIDTRPIVAAATTP